MVSYGTQVLTAAVLTPPLDLQSAGSLPVFGAGTTGDTVNRVQLGADGSVRWGSGSGAVDTRLFRSAAGNLQFSTGSLQLTAGSVDLSLAGQGLKVAEGSNAKQGIATLAAGTVTVANTSVTASSRIQVTGQNANGGTPGAISVSAMVAGTSFTISSTSAADTSIVAYEIFEPG